MEIHPREGVLKEEKFSNTRKTSHQRVCGEFWNLRGQHNQEESKREKPTDYMPSRDSQWRGNPDARVCQQGAGALNRQVWTSCIGWGLGLNSLRKI